MFSEADLVRLIGIGVNPKTSTSNAVMLHTEMLVPLLK